MSNQNHLLKFAYLLLFTAYTVYAIITGNVNVFFLIYIFWIDEFLKTLFDLFRYLFLKENIKDAIDFLNNLKARFFMLFLYFVFIVILYGFVFSFGETYESIGNNILILFFRDTAFNICFLTLLAREINGFIISIYKKDVISVSVNSSGIITLHVSIILGAFAWAAVNNKFDWININLGSLNNYIYIFPFIVIKFLFEMYEIRSNYKKGKVVASLEN